MQKKVYLNEIKMEEILERLNNGEKVYNDNDGCYIGMYNNALALYEESTLVAFNPTIYTNNNQYFLDEVEEPEADESCIGKLCYFWNEEDDEKEIGFLGEIDKEHNFPFAMGFGYSGVGYKHCRALTKEEVMKYIKE